MWNGTLEHVEHQNMWNIRTEHVEHQNRTCGTLEQNMWNIRTLEHVSFQTLRLPRCARQAQFPNFRYIWIILEHSRRFETGSRTFQKVCITFENVILCMRNAHISKKKFENMWKVSKNRFKIFLKSHTQSEKGSYFHKKVWKFVESVQKSILNIF